MKIKYAFLKFCVSLLKYMLSCLLPISLRPKKIGNIWNDTHTQYEHIWHVLICSIPYNIISINTWMFTYTRRWRQTSLNSSLSSWELPMQELSGRQTLLLFHSKDVARYLCYLCQITPYLCFRSHSSTHQKKKTIEQRTSFGLWRKCCTNLTIHGKSIKNHVVLPTF